MLRFSATEARQNFSRVLNCAAGGQPVTIERRRLRFRVVLEPTARKLRPTPGRLKILDPAVADGNWTWQPSRTGLVFRRRRRS